MSATAIQDIALDDDGDAYLDGDDLATVSGGAGIKQGILIAVATYLGEWFKDPSKGFDWLGKVLGVKAPDLVDVRNSLRSLIAAVLGVLDVVFIDISANMSTREARVNYRVTTDFGLLSGTATVRP